MAGMSSSSEASSDLPLAAGGAGLSFWKCYHRYCLCISARNERECGMSEGIRRSQSLPSRDGTLQEPQTKAKY